MARLASSDGTPGLELSPAPISHAAGGLGDDDVLPCGVRFESYGEPIEGKVNLTRGGLRRMLGRLKVFCEKRQGMVQLRDETQSLELSLAAKRSRWTEKIKVTGLAGVPQPVAEVSDELRVNVGILLRQDSETASVEQRGGQVSTFDALAKFVGDLATEAGLAAL